MLHTIIRQPYARTILLAFALLLLVVNTAAENSTRVHAQTNRLNLTSAIQNSKPIELAQATPESANAPTLVPEAKSRASRTIQYTYDNAGRLSGVNYAGGKPIAYTYDANGNLTQRQETTVPLYLPAVKR